MISMKQRFRCADKEGEIDTLLSLSTRTSATAMPVLERSAPANTIKPQRSRAGPKADWSSVMSGFTTVLENEAASPEWKNFFSGIKDNFATYKAAEETATQPERVAKFVDSIFTTVSQRVDTEPLEPSRPVTPKGPDGENFRTAEQSSLNTDAVNELFDSIVGSVSKSVSSYYEGHSPRENDRREQQEEADEIVSAAAQRPKREERVRRGEKRAA
eukprot:GHVN01037370.1.p2 GENE.GHVN01037370.1~~GHVN01037370.1.p2  ORF type:complete len:215 (-),score=34.27 GHVN01037370.1:1226-1870(-)